MTVQTFSEQFPFVGTAQTRLQDVERAIQAAKARHGTYSHLERLRVRLTAMCAARSAALMAGEGAQDG